MDNCGKHKKEVAGISDMKVLAEMIGDLHYETLAELLKQLSEKLGNDGINDGEWGRRHLSNVLCYAAGDLHNAAKNIQSAWQISKPFMTNKS